MRRHSPAALLAAAAALGCTTCAVAGFSYGFIFGLPSGVDTNGSAAHTDVVRLTTGGDQAGSMFATDKQVVSAGFTTSFRFRIDNGPIEVDGDGFAFVLHNDPDGSGALGGGGSDLGYGGIMQSLAIEFDTFGFGGEFNTPHVSIQTQGLDPNSTQDDASLGEAFLPGLGVDILDGQYHVVRINYEPPQGEDEGALNVYIDELDVLSIAIDLTAVGPVGSEVDLTDEDGSMYVGFTAGTGLADSIHVLEDWSFDDQTNDCASPYVFLGYAGHGGPGSTYTAGARYGGSGPLTFAWYRDGEPLSDDDHFNGTQTMEMRINDLSALDEGVYECLVHNGCGNASSGLFTIDLTPACNLADITEVGGTAEAPGNSDNQLTVDDIIVFVNLFSDGTGCPNAAPCSLGDVCGVGGPPEPSDGQLTVDDVIAFVNAFSDGC